LFPFQLLMFNYVSIQTGQLQLQKSIVDKNRLKRNLQFWSLVLLTTADVIKTPLTKLARFVYLYYYTIAQDFQLIVH
jgi:hypothetical protein